MIKAASCKKCEKSYVNTPRVKHLDYWEDFAQESAPSAAPKSQSAPPARMYVVHVNTEVGSAKVKQLRIVDNNEIIREDTSDM